MKKTTLLLVSVCLFAAACATAPEATVDTGEGKRFVPMTVDWRTDVGQQATAMLDGQGQPAIVYLGFLEVLEEGDIPESRPLYLSATPGVLEANLSATDKDVPFWNIAEVSWHRVQFKPPTGDPLLQTTTEDGKANAPVANASANSVVDANGVTHAAWTDSEGVKYANNAQEDTFDPGAVAAAPDAMGVGIAVDEGGLPWISYFDGHNVMLATTTQDGWITHEIGTANICAECPAARTRVDVTKDGNPVVAYTDGTSPILATVDADIFVNGLPEEDVAEEEDGARVIDLGIIDRDGSRLDPASESTVESNAGGFGISLDVDGSGTAHLLYYTPDGGVQHAVGDTDGGSFQTSEIVAAPTNGGGTPFGWSTGISVTDSGVMYVTWYDVGSNGVKVSAIDKEATEYPVPGAEAGNGPSIIASPDGKTVWVAWYDSVTMSLKAAQLTESTDIKIAAVSPSPVVEAAAPPAPAPECEPVVLDLEAPAGAVTTGFAETCLAADAGEPFTISFSNQDPGVPHNVAVYQDDTAAELIAATEVAAGPIEEPLDVDPLDKGNYFYRCDVHPNMNGTLVVA